MAVKVISEDRSSQKCLQNIINVIKSELFTTGVICTCTVYMVYIVHVHVFGISITLCVEVVSQLLISEKLLYGHQEKSLTLAHRSTKQELIEKKKDHGTTSYATISTNTTITLKSAHAMTLHDTDLRY